MHQMRCSLHRMRCPMHRKLLEQMAALLLNVSIILVPLHSKFDHITDTQTAGRCLDFSEEHPTGEFRQRCKVHLSSSRNHPSPHATKNNYLLDQATVTSSRQALCWSCSLSGYCLITSKMVSKAPACATLQGKSAQCTGQPMVDAGVTGRRVMRANCNKSSTRQR